MSNHTSSVALPISESSAIALEKSNVHTVYNQIASHFSSTRYAPWPLPLEFIQTRAPGSVGVDLGCGNGKYLGTSLNPSVFIIGTDASHGLIEISHKRGHEAHLADSLYTPHPPSKFDFAISIAVIHHFSTPSRRKQAIAEMLRLLKQDGEGLVYVWALEQKASRRGWKEGDDQDIMVPWKSKAEDGGEVTYERYYHLFKKGELEELVQAAGGDIIRTGYDRDNWWAVIRHLR